MIAEHAIQAAPRIQWRPPLEGDLDWVQFRALVEVYLKQGLRPAAGAKGNKAHPVRRLVVSLVVLGALFSYSGAAFPDLPTYLIVLFTAGIGMAMLAVLPDTYDVRQRNLELLASKPIGQRTHMAARAAMQFFFAALVASCFSIVPLVAGCWRFGASWRLLAGLYVCLNIGCFSAVAIWLRGVLVCSRWFGIDRIRRISQLAMSILPACFMLPMIVRFASGSGAYQMRISFASSRGVRLLPPAWFATFLLDDLDPNGYILRIAAVLLVAFAAWIALSPGSAKNYPALIEKIVSGDQQAAHRPFIVGVLAAIRSLPRAGRWILPPQAYGVASLIATQTAREDQSRLRSIGLRISLVSFFVLCFVLDHQFFLWMVSYHSFLLLVGGSDMIGKSSQPEAAWVFGALPLEGRTLMSGIRRVILLNYFSLPFVLAAVVCIVYYPLFVAVILLAAFAVEANILISLLVAVRPRIPLSNENLPGQGYGGFVASLGSNLVSSAFNLTLFFLVEYCGIAGAVLACMALLMLICIGHGLSLLASDRLSLAELEH